MTGPVLVTGADGFVGRVLVDRLRRHGRPVVAVTRGLLAERSGGGAGARGDLADFAHWPDLLAGVEGVVHLAARAHVIRDAATDPLAEFRRTNVAGTECLLRAAVASGVHRFVFLSSIGVLGNDSGARAFKADDPPRPVEDYARSKWEAEQRLHSIAPGTSIETVVVRPPLVYGPGVKGNFRRLLGLVDRGLPLPFAGLEARRSFIGVENLAELLVACVDHPEASGQTFLAADGEDVTLPGLLEALGRGLGRPARLFRAPWGLLDALAKLAGRHEDLARLAGSLRVDASRTRRVLGWEPRVSFEAGIRAMAHWYLQEKRS